jgi:HEAT repeat protein
MAADLLKNTAKDDFVPMALVRVAEMMSTLDNAAEALVQGLSHPNEDVRQQFGSAIISIGSEYGVEAIIPAVDLVLKNNDLSTNEMPYILGWIEDPDIAPQIHRFLEVDNTGVVYAAIEAIVHVGDPDSIEALKKLVDDPRKVPLDDDIDDDIDDDETTIGNIAMEAIDLLDPAK